jgi:hypothetical protein
MLLKYPHKGEALAGHHMIGSRRLILIGAIVGAVLLLGGLATLLAGAGGSSERKACDTFMTYIIAGDYTKSYELFSESAKSKDSAAEWKSTVIGLIPGYYGAEKSLVETIPVAAYEDDTEATAREEYRYTIKNPSTTTEASCYTYDDGKNITVDGFTSKVKE